MSLIKNLEQRIKLVKYSALLVSISSIGIVALTLMYANKQISESRKQIYVLSDNTPVLAMQTDQKINRPAEYKSQINLFHSLFFNITPDEKNIEYNISKAMYLIDESGLQQYTTLKEKGFFSQIMQASAFVNIQTDSIVIDMSTKAFIFYGKQKIERKTSVLYRTLITTGKLKDIPRSENNAHGVMITEWKTIENNDIEKREKVNI